MKFSIGFQFNIEISRNGKITRLSLPSWGRLRKQVKSRDEKICQYCGVEAQVGHVDHVIPLSRGGTDTIDNLVWSCRPCNLSKGSKLLDEWEYCPDPESTPEQVLDLTVDDIDIRFALESIEANELTRIMIRQGDEFRSPRIVNLSTVWDVLEVSYATGDWTRDGWQVRGIGPSAWRDYQNFLKSKGFWQIFKPDLIKAALFKFCYPELQEKNANPETNQPTGKSNAW